MTKPHAIGTTGTVHGLTVSGASKMFQQTFVQNDTSARKPFSLGLSLLLQATVLALLAIIPLLYSPQLPVAQLRSFLLTPPPHIVSVPNRPVVPAGRIPTVHRFIFHPASSNQAARSLTKILENEPSAPDIDIPGAIGEPNGTASSILGAMDAPPSPAAPKPAVQPAIFKPAQPKTLRLGSGISEANLIHRVQPLYPPLARSARVSGTVEFSATISRDGLIENLQLMHGHPLLVEAARQAIIQWRYKPTMLNGQPVEVITSIIVTFTLN